MPDLISVQIFPTCLVEAIRPEAGLAAVQVLERLGCEVSCPAGQTCCGQPAYNAGSPADARAMARHTISVLSRSRNPVVVPSGSCAEMIVHRYPELFDRQPRWAGKARELAARTFEFSQFVAERFGPERLHPRHSGRLAYQASCHLLRGLGVDEAPRRLLGRVEGASVVSLPEPGRCCGFGGLFAVHLSEISGAMLARKVEDVLASGATTLVGCDLGCLIHLEGALRRQATAVRTLHLAEVLAGEP